MFHLLRGVSKLVADWADWHRGHLPPASGNRPPLAFVPDHAPDDGRQAEFSWQ